MKIGVVTVLCVMLGGCFGGPTQREYNHLLQEKNILALEQKPLETHIYQLDKGFIALTNQYGEVNSSLARLELAFSEQNRILLGPDGKGSTSNIHLGQLDQRVKGIEQWLTIINSSQKQILERLDGPHALPVKKKRVRRLKKVKRVPPPKEVVKPMKVIESSSFLPEAGGEKEQMVATDDPVTNLQDSIPGITIKGNPLGSYSIGLTEEEEGAGERGVVIVGDREGSSNNNLLSGSPLPESSP